MKTLKRIVIILAIVSSLQALPIPSIGDAIRQTQHPKEFTEPKEKPLVQIKGIKPTYKPELVDNKSFKKVLVKQFYIEGNIHIKSKVLLSLLNSYKNTKISFNDMQVIASIITKEYRKQGYIVARAYIPVQNIHDGILQIAIIEGEYGEFKILNNSRLTTSRIQNMLDAAKKNKVINDSSLEHVLLQVNDLPGVAISSATIEAGKVTGSSNLLITVDNSNRYDGYILVNDYGGRYTGINQLTIGINIYSPLNIGDKLFLTGFISDSADLINGLISYSLPIYYSGLRAEVGYSNTAYSLAKEFTSLDTQGTANTYYAMLTYPIVKKRAENLNIFIKIENNELKDEIRSVNFITNKKLTAFRVGLNYTKTDLTWFSVNQQLRTSIVLTAGNLMFEDETQQEIDKIGANTQGNYSKVKLSLNYDVALSKNTMFENSLAYQHGIGGKNLDGMEDFSIGGAYGVKLYPNGELSAENGYLIKTEIKYSLPNIKRYFHKFGFFYDIGEVDMQNRTQLFKSRVLQDAGVAYYADYKKFFGNIQVAWKIDNQKISTEPDEDYKVLFMVGLGF